MESQPDAVSPNSAAAPDGAAGSGGSSRPSSRLPELVLVVSGAGAADGEFYIQPNLSIGRNPSNTVVLEKGWVGPLHAVVRRDGQGGLMLATMEGADPPQVGGVKQTVIPLRSGVEFTLGAATFRVVHASSVSAAQDIQASPEPPADSEIPPAGRPEQRQPAAAAQWQGDGKPPAGGGGGARPAAIFSAPELLAVANSQRAANLFVLVAIVGLAALTGATCLGVVFPHGVMAVTATFLPAAVCALDAIFLILLWRMARATRMFWPWAWVVAAMIPLAGLIVLLVLSRKASAILQSNGVAVGFLGARAGAIRELRARAGGGRRWWPVGLAALAVALFAALAVWQLDGGRGAASEAAGLQAMHQQRYHRAMVDFRKGAAAGSGGAMYALGWLYANGQGVPRDYAKARAWFERAEQAGPPWAAAIFQRFCTKKHWLAAEQAGNPEAAAAAENAIKQLPTGN